MPIAVWRQANGYRTNMMARLLAAILMLIFLPSLGWADETTLTGQVNYAQLISKGLVGLEIRILSKMAWPANTVRGDDPTHVMLGCNSTPHSTLA